MISSCLDFGGCDSQRSTRKGMQYLTKWVGWPAEDSTWEEEEAFILFDCVETLQDQIRRI